MEQVRWLLTDEIWQMLEAIIRSIKSAAGAPPITPDRLFLEAVLYRARVGCPWRDLPKCFGSWNAVYQRFRRWEKKGIWKALCERLPKDKLGAIKNLFVASTLVRAHAHAAGREPQPKRGSSGTGAGSQSWRVQHEDALGGSEREHPL
ncbi:MAG: IS5 family transposase [Gemmatales bacterium]|nr:IS5 family transposase [Gemmatales bacterium]